MRCFLARAHCLRSTLAAILWMSLILSGCAGLRPLANTLAGDSTQASSPTPVLDRIRASGRLRVATAANYPPLNALDRSGEHFGMELDLARFLAKAIDVELEIVDLPFSELLGALEAGQADAVMSAMTMTPKRNLRVAFAGPYFTSGISALLKEGSPVRALSELDQPTSSITALEGTTSEVFIRDSIPNARLVPAKDYDAAVALVLDGQVDAMVADYPICVVQKARRPKAKLRTLPQPATFEPIGIALPANDPLFVNLVQNYLTSLERTGLLATLRSRWFDDASWARRLPAAPGGPARDEPTTAR